MASGMTKTQLTRHLAEKLESNNKTAAAFWSTWQIQRLKRRRKMVCSWCPALAAW